MAGPKPITTPDPVSVPNPHIQKYTPHIPAPDSDRLCIFAVPLIHLAILLLRCAGAEPLDVCRDFGQRVSRVVCTFECCTTLTYKATAACDVHACDAATEESDSLQPCKTDMSTSELDHVHFAS